MEQGKKKRKGELDAPSLLTLTPPCLLLTPIFSPVESLEPRTVQSSSLGASQLLQPAQIFERFLVNSSEVAASSPPLLLLPPLSLCRSSSFFRQRISPFPTVNLRIDSRSAGRSRITAFDRRPGLTVFDPSARNLRARRLPSFFSCPMRETEPEEVSETRALGQSSFLVSPQPRPSPAQPHPSFNSSPPLASSTQTLRHVLLVQSDQPLQRS